MLKLKAKKQSFLFIVAALLFIACSPDQFMLNKQNDRPLYGFIMSDLDSVQKTADNELRLHGGGIAAVRAEEITQLDADMTVKIISGDGLRFSFRTVSNEYDTNPGISFDFTPNGCTVKEKDKLLTSVDSIKAKPGSRSRIHIKNDGIHFFITVDCDTVIHSTTNLCSTEYIILKSLYSTEALVSSINFSSIRVNE